MNESWNELASWVLEDGWNREQRETWLKLPAPHCRVPVPEGFCLRGAEARTPQQRREALHLPALVGVAQGGGPILLHTTGCSKGSWGGRLMKDQLCSGGPGAGRGTGIPWCLLNKHCRVGRSCGRVFDTHLLFAGKYPQPASPVPAPLPHPSPPWGCWCKVNGRDGGRRWWAHGSGFCSDGWGEGGRKRRHKDSPWSREDTGVQTQCRESPLSDLGLIQRAPPQGPHSFSG